MPFKVKCRTCVRRGFNGDRLDAIVNVIDMLSTKQSIRDRRLKDLGI